MARRTVIILCLLVSAIVAHRTDSHHEESVQLDIEEGESYHGVVRENETIVEVVPAIRAKREVCGFSLLHPPHHANPFHLNLVNEQEATLTLAHPVSCEARTTYRLQVVAVGCDGERSAPAPLHVTFDEVNQHAPVWVQDSYERTVDEGKIYDELIRVSATDKDCSPKYGDICKYEILNADQPFTVDNEGAIRNTAQLRFDESHVHVLSVVAYDCGMRASPPALVTVKVRRGCVPAWRGVAERVDYAAGGGALALFPSARLAACASDARCPGVTRVVAKVSLTSARTPRACDRDTYSLRAQQASCGLPADAVDLLPHDAWTQSLVHDSKGDWEQWQFDGASSAAVVPESAVRHSLASRFAVAAWLRHEPRPDRDAHAKEHLLCLADDHKMNRHHYALFVRNCRLILLVRRDFSEGELNIFRPAEWRWRAAEVCDGQWHHYAVNVRFPDVELYVDGALRTGAEVIDDWPLHPAAQVSTRLAVGACWQGSEGGFKHHLNGSMAGLALVLGQTLQPHQLQCVAACREGLSLAPDLYLSSVSVEGDSVSDVETLLRRVSYGDGRAFPTPGRRNVHVNTTITCDNGHQQLAMPVENYIMVLSPQTPSIIINGSGDAARDYTHFRVGVPVFDDLTLRVMNSAKTQPKEEAAQRLDSCVVSVYPALNPDHEALALPLDGAEGDIRATVTRDGLTLTGADSAANYARALRLLTYSNKKPAYYLNRVFKLTCSELDGRFTSNEYVQTLTVVHPHSGAPAPPPPPRPHGLADKLDDLDRENMIETDAERSGEVETPPQAPAPAHARLPAPHSLRQLPAPEHHHYNSSSKHVALLMGVVCCGAVVLGVGVAVARARSHRHHAHARRRHAHAHAQAQAHELAWDDSALNITLNPMDDVELATTTTVAAAAADAAAMAASVADASVKRSIAVPHVDSDSDAEDRDSSSDDDDDNPVMCEYRHVSQLEWDHDHM